jgi:hypothetical protein
LSSPQSPVKFHYVAPLYNFEADIIEPIGLDARTIIRKLTEQERERMLAPSELGPSIPIFKIYQLNYVAELVAESRRPDPFDDVYKVVLALRLFKAGDVSFDQIRFFPSDRRPGLMSGTLTSHNEPAIIPAQTAYRLDASDIDPLKAFWTELRDRDLDSPPALGVAVRRFNFSFGRTRLEDRLLDLAIAFEALLLRDRERGKTDKMARRCSRLLAEDPQQRRVIYRETERFYGRRSELVHGRVLPQVTTEYVARIQDNLRRSIREMLVRLQGENHDAFLEDLDKQSKV